MQYENGPALWDKILAELPILGAVIAGGAVRDYLMGLKPKDIDVFIRDQDHEAPPTSEHYFVESYEARMGFNRIESKPDRLEEYAKFTGVQLVSEKTIEGYLVQLIQLEKMEGGRQLVETFDFNINKCWYENGTIYVMKSTLRDDANHQVTLAKFDRMERSQKRFDRFNESHGGKWTYVTEQNVADTGADPTEIFRQAISNEVSPSVGSEGQGDHGRADDPASEQGSVGQP